MKKTILAALFSCLVIPSPADGEARTPTTSLQRARDTFRAADRDSSKGLSFQELQIAGLSRKEFERYDEGRDGQWTQDEFLLYYSQLLTRSKRQPSQDLQNEVSLVKERMTARQAGKTPTGTDAPKSDAPKSDAPAGAEVQPPTAAEKLKAKLKPSRTVPQTRPSTGVNSPPPTSEVLEAKPPLQTDAPLEEPSAPQAGPARSRPAVETKLPVVERSRGIRGAARVQGRGWSDHCRKSKKS